MSRWTIQGYKDRAGGYRWTMTARNGRIVADSGEAYKTPAGLRRAIGWLVWRMKPGALRVKYTIDVPPEGKRLSP